jgi:hypothetical protein
MTIPVSSSGDKGDPGDGSIGQTFKGSPLRIVGAWTSGKKYYDGKRDAEIGLPKYPNLTSAYSDSNLNEGYMFLVSDNATDNTSNVYEDYVVHIKGRRV